MLRNVLARFRGERGQILVMMTLLLVSLLGMIGLAVDGGYLYAQRRQAQNAADAAALAAAERIAAGGTTVQAQATGLSYAAANGFDNDGTSNTVTVLRPPTSGPNAGDNTYVEVVIEDEPQTFLIHMVASGATVQGRGVAKIGAGSGAYAIFTNKNDCGDDDVFEGSGSNSTVTGMIHSNGTMKLPGSNNDFLGGTTYTCSINVSGSNNTFSPSAQQTPVKAFPVSYTYSDFPCTYTRTGDLDITSVNTLWVGNSTSSNQLKTNVICATGKITLSDSDVTGTVTLVAHGEVNISGSNFNLTHNWGNVLIYTDSTSDSAMDLSGSGGVWDGMIIARNGHLKFAGSNNISMTGSLISNTNDLSGSNWSLTGAYASAGNAVVLVE